MIDISVIIPVYNPGLLMKRCLDSVLAQKGKYEFEVIMVDDGSTDDSVAIIDGYNEPRFTLLHQQNSGPAAARNKGIVTAKGKYIAFIDADDYWEPEFFSEMIGFMEEHDECVAASCGQRHLTVSGSNETPTCLSDYREPVVLENFFSFWAKYNHVCTGSMIAKAKIIKSLNGMREDLRLTEDLELWALIATQGKWGFIPKVLFTSDGTGIINSKDDWLHKMSVRWNNTPSFESWLLRIKEKDPELVVSENFLYACGYITRDYVYSYIMLKRDEYARQQSMKYGKYFVKDKWGKLMNICKHTKLTWWVMCRVLRYREYNRFK